MNKDSPTPAQYVLDFWFGDGWQRGWPSEDRNPLWFGGGAAQDTLIRERFGAAVGLALDGALTEWESEPSNRLALVLLLDQFSRNVYRGQARAFSGDPRAQRLVTQTLERGDDAALPTVGRVFLLMPLMHAEDLALQDACVMRFSALHRECPPELQARLEGNLAAAAQHRDIVARFGRFPHRNAVLGRTSTAEELAFLTDGPRFGQ